MNEETFENINKINVVGLSFSSLILLLSFFWFSKVLVMITLLLDVVLFGTAILIKKYWILFSSITVTNKFAKQLNNNLNKINNG